MERSDKGRVAKKRPTEIVILFFLPEQVNRMKLIGKAYELWAGRNRPNRSHEPGIDELKLRSHEPFQNRLNRAENRGAEAEPTKPLSWAVGLLSLSRS
jgi:hypothetical protein